MEGDELVFTSPWSDLRGRDPMEARQRDSMLSELFREVARGHPLFQKECKVLGRCHHCDDILIESEGKLIGVHLTWATQPESPPLPRVRWFASARDFYREAEQHR